MHKHSTVAVVAMAACVACGAPQPGGEGGGAVGVGGGSGGAGVGGGSGGAGAGSGNSNRDALQSGQRLKAVAFKGSDGSSYGLPEATFWDTARNENCWSAMADDRKRRCLPIRAALVRNSYSDAACVTELVRVSAPNPDCDGTVAGVYEPRVRYGVLPKSEGNTCGGGSTRYEVHLLGAPFAGQVYRIVNGACLTQPAESGVSYFEFGPAVEPTEFVEMTLALL